MRSYCTWTHILLGSVFSFIVTLQRAWVCKWVAMYCSLCLSFRKQYAHTVMFPLQSTHILQAMLYKLYRVALELWSISYIIATKFQKKEQNEPPKGLSHPNNRTKEMLVVITIWSQSRNHSQTTPLDRVHIISPPLIERALVSWGKKDLSFPAAVSKRERIFKILWDSLNIGLYRASSLVELAKQINRWSHKYTLCGSVYLQFTEGAIC